MRPASWLLTAVLGVMLNHGSARGVESMDLNTAPAAQLQELPGIGPKKAEAIIALRQKRPFSRVSQLLEVRGIGRKTLERLKPLVRVGSGSLDLRGSAGESATPKAPLAVARSELAEAVR